MSTVEIGELACHPRPAADLDARATARRRERDVPVVALVGRPNVGKSTFFARASGQYAESANVPGTTVGVARRDVTVAGRPAVLVDLPGTFSLTDESAGLPSFWRLLVAERPDAVLIVADAGDLARHLPLALACRDLQLPIVLAANLSDEAEARGVRIDTARLSQLLAAPVVLTIGRQGVGVRSAVEAVVRRASGAHRSSPAARGVRPVPPYPAAVVRDVTALAARIERQGDVAALPRELAAAVADGWLSPIAAATIVAADIIEPERWAVAERWASETERRVDVRVPLADCLARQITAPWPGLPLFVLATIVSLGATMTVGTAMSGLLSDAWSAMVTPVLTATVTAIVPIPQLAQAVLWAVDGGLLSMLAVGIPYVLSFYLILAVLEDSGYLAGAAVLSDRIFNALGLPGRAAIPILAATGCNVPAIYGSRVLDTRRERLLASFLICLTPCSARSAVVVAALVPFAGPGVAFGAFGLIAAIVVTAGLGANALIPGRQSPMVLELPPLRRPIAAQVLRKAWVRFRSFVLMATPVMLAGSFLLGLAYETGLTQPISAAIAPLVGGLLGLPPVAGIALVLAFLRKELALQLLVVLAIAQYGAGAESLATFMSPGQLFVYAVVTAVSIPCAATLATLADEFGWRSAIIVSGAILGVGLVAGAIVARVAGIA